jgi:hypothetical protein
MTEVMPMEVLDLGFPQCSPEPVVITAQRFARGVSDYSACAVATRAEMAVHFRNLSPETERSLRRFIAKLASPLAEVTD